MSTFLVILWLAAFVTMLAMFYRVFRYKRPKKYAFIMLAVSFALFIAVGIAGEKDPTNAQQTTQTTKKE